MNIGQPRLNLISFVAAHRNYRHVRPGPTARRADPSSGLHWMFGWLADFALDVDPVGV